MFDYTILKTINDPKDLKALSIEELKELSSELTHFLRTTVEEVGGHYSSPLGVVDLTIALHYVYNSPADKLVWDVGHQAYAHKILTGRRDQFPTLRTKDGISGFLKRSESQHDIIGAGHASTAISSALGIAHARDKKGTNDKVVAIVGDGALTGGLSYEGLNNLGFHRTQLSIVLNDNSMSISPSVGALSRYLTKVTTNPMYNKMRDDIWHATGKIPSRLSRLVRKLLRKTEEGIKGILTPGVLFEELGLRYIGPINGHSMEELVRAFKAVREMPNPTLVHVYTHKGKGSELAETDSTKYYSMAGRKKETPAEKAPDYSRVFGSVITELAETDDRIVCITAAMEVGTGMSQYVKKYSDRYIDVGIAEGHAVTYASGLASEGLRPVVALYSTFMQRAYDNIFHDSLIQDLPLIICMDRAGLVGPDGPTHHGVFDIPLMRMLPEMVVTAPKDGNELRNLIATALYADKTFSIRYPKDTCYRFDDTKKAEVLPIGKWEILQEGKEIAILATGSMVEIARRAMDQIKSRTGLKPTLVNARFIKPMDEEMLISLVSSHQYILTVEEGALAGGFGSGVLELIEQNGSSIKVHRLGIPDNYIEHATRQQLLDQLDLNEDGILKAVQAMTEK